MAQELGTGYIIISPSTKGLGKAIEGSIEQGTEKGTSKSSGTILKKLGGAFGRIGKIGVGAITGIGTAVTGLAAKGGFDRALNIERARTKLKALGHDTNSVNGIMDDALASVKGTAFGLGDAASVAAGLVASGVKQGKQLTGVLTTVGDVAQIAGVEFKDMGVIFGKVAATGKLQGDEMLQLMEAGIPVLQYLADHYKVTAAEAQKMVSDGKVSFADFEAAMREHLGGAAKSAGDSFDGMLSNLKAAMSRAGEKFATPLIQSITQLGNKAIPVIDEIAGGVGRLADEFAERLASAADQAGIHLDQFAEKLKNGDLTIEDLCGKLGMLVAGFGTLAGVGGNMSPLLGSLDGIAVNADSMASNVVKAMTKAGHGIHTGIGNGVNQAKTMFSNFAGWFDKDLRAQLVLDGNWPAGIIESISQGCSNIKNRISGGMASLKTSATTRLADLAFSFENSSLGSAIMKMGDGISSSIASLKKSTHDKLAGLASGFKNANIGSTILRMGDGIQSAFGNVTARMGRFGAAFSRQSRESLVLEGDPFATFVEKIHGGLSRAGTTIGNGVSKLTGPLKSVAHKAGTLLSPIGDMFGRMGDAIAPKLQAGLSTVGSLVSSFFSPGNFMKFVGVGSIIAGLVTGLGAIDQSMNGQISAMIEKIAVQGPAMILKFSEGVMAKLPDLLQLGGQMVNQMLLAITANLPLLPQTGVDIIGTLVTGLAAQLPVLIPTAVQMILTLVEGLIAQLPTLLQAGLQLLEGLVDGILNALPLLIQALPNIINTFVSELIRMLPRILETGTNLLTGLITGIVNAIPQLVAMLPTIIDNTVNTLMNNLPQIIRTGMQLLMALINGLTQAIPQLIGYLPQIIASIVNTLANNMSAIINAGVQILVALINGLVQAIPQLIGAIPQIISSIKDAFGNVDWGSIGLNIIRGIKDGLMGAAGQLWDAAKNVAKNAWDGAKRFLGINSPSRLFRDTVGKQIAAGMVVGMQRSEDDVSDAGADLAKASLPNMDDILDMAAASTSRGLRTQTTTVPGQSGYVKPTGQQPGGETNRTYNIYANDPDLVVAKIDARETRANAGWGGA